MPRWCSVVDERAEVVGRAEPRGRRVVAGDLVAPRAAERVLGDRQQLDVGEARARRRGRPAGRPSSRYDVDAVAPRAEVHLVDPQRVAGAVAARSTIHAPSPHACVLGAATTLAVAGGRSAAHAIGSAFSIVLPFAAVDRELVAVTRPPPIGTMPAQTPGLALRRQRIAVDPAVPVADHVDTDLAFGAHTANRTPAVGERHARRAHCHSRRWVPSPKRWRSRSTEQHDAEAYGESATGDSRSTVVHACR